MKLTPFLFTVAHADTPAADRELLGLVFFLMQRNPTMSMMARQKLDNEYAGQKRQSKKKES